MTTLKEEILAATLRKQIAYLEGLLDELNQDPLKDKQILMKTRDVESKVRELRSQL